MTQKAIIWDLDQTLVDSRSLEMLRCNREWSAVLTRLDSVLPYKGLPEIVSSLERHAVKNIVVTSSPKHYAQAVLKKFYPSLVEVVAYHDCKHRKPHPEPIECAVNRLCVDKANIAAIGDAHTDILACRGAGVTSVAATWGSTDVGKLKSAGPDMLVETPAELAALLRRLAYLPGNS